MKVYEDWIRDRLPEWGRDFPFDSVDWSLFYLDGFNVMCKGERGGADKLYFAAGSEEELLQIRRELAERGFVKRIYMIIPGSGSGNGGSRNGKGNKKNASGKGPVRQGKVRPLHYLTEDGYDIYVGKNNYQNEMVTFEIATGNDWWFHAKGVPGAHVVVKCSFANQAEEWDMPDEIFELAGAIALVNSKNKDMEKAEVDYLRKKNVKRPNKAAPGYVIYYTNYSLVAVNDLSGYELTEC